MIYFLSRFHDFVEAKLPRQEKVRSIHQTLPAYYESHDRKLPLRQSDIWKTTFNPHELL